MEKVDLSLGKRRESVREPQKMPHPVHFALAEIKEHFDASLKRIEKQGEVARQLLDHGRKEECQDIWRSQIVFLEGILDFFLHEISKYALYQMFIGAWEKSEKYYAIKVPMQQVEEAYENLSAKEWFFSYLDQDIGKQVYLSAESMQDQLNLIGIPFGEVMGKAFPGSTMNDAHRYGRRVVREMFDRRNRIVHQNDRDHASAERTPVTLQLVDQYRRQITDIVNSAYGIAVRKDRS